MVRVIPVCLCAGEAVKDRVVMASVFGISAFQVNRFSIGQLLSKLHFGKPRVKPHEPCTEALRTLKKCLKQHEIFRTTRIDRAERDAVIQGNEAALSRHCQRKKINVCDLVVSQHTAPVNAGFGSERHLIRPKLVIKVSTNLLELVPHGLESGWPQPAVAWKVKNADDPVFDDWAGGNLDLWPLGESQCLNVVNMRLIQQRHPNVHVQQIAQIRSQQIVDESRSWPH